MCLGVAGFKKRIVVLLTIAGLGGGSLMIRSSQSAANQTASEESTSEPNQSWLMEGAENGSLFAADPNFTAGKSYSLGHGEFFFRTMLAVLFVVVLGVAAIYVSKKLLPQITKLPGKEIRVVETVHLGPRKAVHLIEVGHRRLLVGSTNENVTTLADVTSGFAEVPVQEINCD